MYLPAHFQVDDPATQHDLIAAHPLGILVSHGDDGLTANPVPFVLDRTFGAHGRLRAHLARANPQWQVFAAHPDALVIFSGIDHYISPSYYPSKQETGKVVPTWNYIQVHVYGRVKIHDDPVWVGEQIEALTRSNEDSREKPWAVGDAPEAFIAMQKRAIVGMEIEIARIEGKWKLSQNRTPADQEGVRAGLAQEKSAVARAMSALVPFKID